MSERMNEISLLCEMNVIVVLLHCFLLFNLPKCDFSTRNSSMGNFSTAKLASEMDKLAKFVFSQNIVTPTSDSLRHLHG